MANELIHSALQWSRAASLECNSGYLPKARVPMALGTVPSPLGTTEETERTRVAQNDCKNQNPGGDVKGQVTQVQDSIARGQKLFQPEDFLRPDCPSSQDSTSDQERMR